MVKRDESANLIFYLDIYAFNNVKMLKAFKFSNR